MVFKNNLYIILLLLLFLSSKIYSQAEDGKGNYILIGNTIGLKEIKKKNIKEIFAGEKGYWANKSKIILVLPSSKNPLAEVVAKNTYNMSVMSMQKYWLSLTFQGNVNPPLFMDDDLATIKFIESNPGAVGFILEANFKNTKAEKISIEKQ